MPLILKTASTPLTWVGSRFFKMAPRCAISTMDLMKYQFIRRLHQLNLPPKGKSIELNSKDLTTGNIRLLFSGKGDSKNIDISYNNITDDGIKIIANHLKGDPRLRFLNLEGNGLTSQGSASIINLISHPENKLNCIRIGHNNFGDEGAIPIIEALSNNRVLKKIGLNHINLSSKSLIAMSNLLLQNKTIEYLCLSDNSINLENLELFSKALAKNDHLTTLDISGNRLEDQDTSLLFDALHHNRKLTKLFLTYNNMGTQGAKSLANLLRHNKTLLGVDIAYCKLSEDDLEEILSSIEENNFTLKKLNISSNQISDNIDDKLISLLQRNHQLPHTPRMHRWDAQFK